MGYSNFHNTQINDITMMMHNRETTVAKYRKMEKIKWAKFEMSL